MSGRVSLVDAYLRDLHRRVSALEGGTVADYIPELAKADPKHFGICIATVDGHVYEVGDSRVPFTIQSISKPFVYGLALEDRGKRQVLERIGVEPTGDAFNEISLAAETGHPLNPMINAGAIASTSLVAGDSAEDRWNRILALFSLYAGRRLEMNELVYRSERDTGHRNRAISHMLRNFDIIRGDPEPPLDLYFRQCSIEIDCRDLSVMAATLATGGVNPVTGERALEPTNVDEVLSVMTTCGMYDYAGEWVYRVGLPAKSGVAGGILAVLPGQLGIGVFSPPLDPRGNSVRGVAACEALSDEQELHFLRAPRASLSTLRARFDLATCPSKRVRVDQRREALQKTGHRAVVYQLQGDLCFAGMEQVVRRLGDESRELSHLVLDLTRVHDVDLPASRMIIELVATPCDEGFHIAFVGLERLTRLKRMLSEARSANAFPERSSHFDDLDLALEWCEDRLLEAQGLTTSRSEELELEKHAFLENLDGCEREILARHLERREYKAREMVICKDEPANELFLLVSGEISVLTETSRGRLRRLSTLSPGTGFGEAFLIEGATRTAFIRADRVAACLVLSRSAFRQLAATSPVIAAKLLENLLQSSVRIIRDMNREVRLIYS